MEHNRIRALIIGVSTLVVGVIFMIGMCIFSEWQLHRAVDQHISNQKAETQKKEITINIKTPATYGIVTIYDNDDVIYACQGDMQILNDGTNGQPIEVVVDVTNNS